MLRLFPHLWQGVILRCRQRAGFRTNRRFRLKFGNEIRTPAMQAGLVKKRLSFREIFTIMAIHFWRIFMFLRNRTRAKEFSWSTAQ